MPATATAPEVTNTANPIRYRMAWCGFTTIPAGTRCKAATNLPADPGGQLYWCDPWPGMSEAEESWMRNYGFLIYPEQTTGIDPEQDALDAGWMRGTYPTA